MKEKYVTIFSGLGNLDQGFEKNFQGVLAVEKDKTAAKILEKNKEKFFPNLTIWNRDIFTITDEEIAQWKGVSGLIGGPQCQPFSSGKHGFDPTDERIRGLPEFLRWARILEPKFFVFENTFGLLQGKKKVFFEYFLEEAEKLNYKVSFRVLNAHDYGNAQNRKRLIAVGVHKTADWSFTFPSPVPESQKKYVRDILKGEALGECIPYSEQRKNIIKHVPEGGHWRHLPTKELQKEALGVNFEKQEGGMTGAYRRLHRDRPCPTLTTSPAQRNTMLTHPIWDRPLSIAEYRRAMGIPEDYHLEGSIADKYKAIGNAVPYELAVAISNAIVESQKQKVSIVAQATQEEKEWKQPDFPPNNDDEFKQLDLFSIESQEEEWGQLKLF
ncbi:DNA cytosine methyltransferase [Priestia megaterium]|uniref:DNA cytosine methyltransferase n=1 Tax=Priestia megaterium TaxID=1404 RepID=UPI002E1D9708|nr:DNA cytosine methyltransferase [Priestia megaterium]